MPARPTPSEHLCFVITFFFICVLVDCTCQCRRFSINFTLVTLTRCWNNRSSRFILPYDKLLTLSHRYQVQKLGHGNAQAERPPLFFPTPPQCKGRQSRFVLSLITLLKRVLSSGRREHTMVGIFTGASVPWICRNVTCDGSSSPPHMASASGGL